MANQILLSVLCLSLLVSIVRGTTPQDNTIRSNDIDVDVDPSDPLVPLLADIIGERYRLLQMLMQTNEEPILSFSPYTDDDVPLSSDVLPLEGGEFPAYDVVRQPMVSRMFKRLEPEFHVLIRMAIMRKLREHAQSRKPLHLSQSIGMRFKKDREEILDGMTSPDESGDDGEKMQAQKRMTDDERDAVRSAVLDLLRNSRKSVELQGMRGGR